MNELFEKYKKDIEKNLNMWLKENEYENGVKLEGEVLNDLMDEFLCFLCSQTNFSNIMDEIDKDMLLGEYRWCKEEEEEEE